MQSFLANRSRSYRSGLLFAALLVASMGRMGGAIAQDEALVPSAAMPAVNGIFADDYFIELLKWSKDVDIKPVRARVTYLDAPLYIAWLKWGQPGLSDAAIAERLNGFPEILRFRVGYRAAERSLVKSSNWQLRLAWNGSEGIAPQAAHQVVSMDLKNDSAGSYWEDIWDYEFKVPSGLLSSGLAGFDITLVDSEGTSGKASWTFGEQLAAQDNADAYVPYLGGVLSGACALLLVAFFMTWPRRGSLS